MRSSSHELVILESVANIYPRSLRRGRIRTRRDQAIPELHTYSHSTYGKCYLHKLVWELLKVAMTERNGRKTLTTVQGLPKKFDQKKILKVIKKKFACNGTIVNDTEMGEVIQLQGDQRKDVQEFLVDKKEGLELDAKTIKVSVCQMITFIVSMLVNPSL